MRPRMGSAASQRKLITVPGAGEVEEVFQSIRLATLMVESGLA